MFGCFILSFPNGDVGYVLCLSLFMHELKLWVNPFHLPLLIKAVLQNLHVLQTVQSLNSKMFVFQKLGVS